MESKKNAGKTTEKKTTSKSSENGQGMTGSEFHQLFLDSLQDMYWAEKNLAKALPKLQKGATSEDLAAAIEKHTVETTEHASLLEQVFEALGEKAKAKKCEAMEGLIEEANTILKDTEKDTSVRDAGIIMAAQKVEHYEIASYGSLRTLANRMGHTEVAAILEQILENEKETDVALTALAESYVNEQAAAE
jgi:ferritin-like metal-binding protein YciE